MNLFWLDLHPRKSAKYACDQHINKMCIEHAQMLCTVLHHIGFRRLPMKSLGMGRSLLQWVAEDFANFAYLLDLEYFYNLEYEARYGKTHKSWLKALLAVERCGGVRAIRQRFRQLGLDPNRGVRYVNSEQNDQLWSCITVPPVYVADEYRARMAGDRDRQLRAVVRSYRHAYKFGKSRFARYYHSTPPAFMRGRCKTKNAK